MQNPKKRPCRLDDFGFGTEVSSSQKFFNPFATELAEERAAAPTPVVSVDIVFTEPGEAGVEEALPPGTVALFPQTPVAPLPESSEEVCVPMVQPRSKEGQRLLYKHPLLPRVGVRGSYALLVGTSDRSEAAWLVQFDGAANPNPGPASSGAVLWSPKGLDGKRSVVFEAGKYLGKATNNIAEAQGLLLGLQIAATRGAREVLIEGDSELIVFQQTGKYQVKDRNLKVWWAQAQAAMMDETSFDWVAIKQVPREQNERADSITKEVLRSKEGFMRA